MKFKKNADSENIYEVVSKVLYQNKLAFHLKKEKCS